MQKLEEIILEWKILKEWGDVNKIAAILEIDQSQVSRILSGDQKPTTEQLVKICEFFQPRKDQRAKIR